MVGISINIRRGGIALAAAFSLLIGFAADVMALQPPKPRNVHNSSSMVGGGCRACHSGSRMNTQVKDVCMQCHGGEADLIKAEKRKVLNPYFRTVKDIRDIDMGPIFSRLYSHPVGENPGVHSSAEQLPESSASTPRHVECVDCHQPHMMQEDRTFAGIKGTTKDGQYGIFARNEYEICFNCHSDSYNLPVYQTNKRMEFDPANPSYHPVVAEGRNTVVPSLMKPYTPRKVSPGDISIIRCTDCHNSDDRRGPQGPHGSNYAGLLARNYSMLDNVDERPQDYDLCYGCHKRSSILGDVSFKYHSLHIKGDLVRGVRGTSCYTCHDAHGSRDNTHLISFNTDVVFKTSTTLELRFVDKGEFRGECYLRCHGVNHSPKSY